MYTRPFLRITWAKAFDEVYCHHASLFVPRESQSLFPPEVVRIGVVARTNIVEDKKVKSYYNQTESCYLPCDIVADGFDVLITSTSLIDKICLDSWTTLKNKARGIHKQFPTAIFYQIHGEPQRVFPIDFENWNTPYLLSEPKILELKEGEKVDVEISLDKIIVKNLVV